MYIPWELAKWDFVVYCEESALIDFPKNACMRFRFIALCKDDYAMPWAIRIFSGIRNLQNELLLTNH